jgi:hypothetical protein
MLGLAAALSPLFTLPSAHSAENDPWAIAQKFDIAGKGQPLGCLPFAFDLSARFIFTKTESSIVVFDWRLPEGQRGRHAMVVFRDAQGRLWAMDNLRTTPLWLQGTKPEQWISEFMPRARTRLVSSIPNAYARDELAQGNPDPDSKVFQDAAAVPRDPDHPLRR